MSQYFYLVASVCEGGLVVSGALEERRMPVTPNPAGRISVTEERKKVTFANSEVHNYV